jgi:hypothetical protein
MLLAIIMWLGSASVPAAVSAFAAVRLPVALAIGILFSPIFRRRLPAGTV